MKNVAFYNILYLWLYYRPVDRKLARYFLVEPSRREVGHPFTMQFQVKCHACWCYTKSLWYCRGVTKQSDRWHFTLQMLYQYPFNFFWCCGPLYTSLNSTSSSQLARFESMESTEPSRGKKKLIDAGFMFTFQAFSSDSTKRFWRCVIRSCQCRLHTDVNDVIINRIGHRTHGSDAAGVEVAKIKANTKRRALDTMELLSQIHDQVFRFIGQAVQRQMPSISATKQLIQRARAQIEAPVVSANTCKSRISRCTRQYKFYYPSPDVDELFLLGDSGQIAWWFPNRVMIFGRVNHRNGVQDMDFCKIS